tara:strand:- start:1359 stop:1988 length:630 start_codon:yes stop_codon:yes gene_type:complete
MSLFAWYAILSKNTKDTIKNISTHTLMWIMRQLVLIDMHMHSFQNIIDRNTHLQSIQKRVFSFFILKNKFIIVGGKIIERNRTRIDEFTNSLFKFDDEDILLVQHGKDFKTMSVQHISEDAVQYVPFKSHFPLVNIVFKNKECVDILLKNEEYDFYFVDNIFNLNLFTYILNAYYPELIKGRMIESVDILSFIGTQIKITKSNPYIMKL